MENIPFDLNPPTIQLSHESPDWGIGYDSIMFEFMGNSAITAKSQLPIDLGETVKEQYNLQYFETEEDFARSISVSVEAAGNIMGVQIEGSASLLNSVKMKSTTVGLVAHVRLDFSGKTLDKNNITLKPELENLMTVDPLNFFRQYGNYFLMQAKQGAELIVVLTTDFNSVEEKTEASASLKVEYGTASAKADMNLKIQKFSSSYAYSLYFYQTSYLSPFPDPGTPAGAKVLQDYISNFPTLVKGTNNPATFSVEVVKYGSFVGYKAFSAFEQAMNPILNIVGSYPSVICRYQDLEQKIEYYKNAGISNNTLAAAYVAIGKDINFLLNEWVQKKDSLKFSSVDDLYKQNLITSPDIYEQTVRDNTITDPILTGNMIYLHHVSTDKYFTPVINGYPTLGVGNKVQLKLLGTGTDNKVSTVQGQAIQGGSTVYFQTAETVMGNNNILGAFNDHQDLYYDADGYLDKQNWKVLRLDKTTQPVNYGDKVMLLNIYRNQNMIQNILEGSYIDTDPNGTDTWIIERT